MDKITTVASHLPGDMGRELNKQLKSIFKDMSYRLHDRDQIFLKTIDEHKKVVLALQQPNESSIKSLTDKVFELSTMISEFKNDMTVRTNNAMALVHQQGDQADVRQQKLRADIAISVSQIQELVDTVKHLSEANDDKKGEKPKQEERLSQGEKRKRNQK